MELNRSKRKDCEHSDATELVSLPQAKKPKTPPAREMLLAKMSAWISKKQQHETFFDVAKIDEMLHYCKLTPQETMDGFYTFREICSSDKYAPLLEYLLENRIISSSSYCYRLNTFFRCSALPNRAYTNMQLMFQHGADPNFLMPWSTVNGDDIYVHNLYRLALSGEERLLSFLLRNGAQPNLTSSEYNPLLACTRYCERTPQKTINTLLYYGAQSNLSLNMSDADPLLALSTPLAYAQLYKERNPRCAGLQHLCDLVIQGHARRVHRMAGYLQRVFTAGDEVPVLPAEITYIIAQHLYGPLSDADHQLINHYPADDYKKERMPKVVNNLKHS